MRVNGRVSDLESAVLHMRLSEKLKSDIYRDMLPLLNSRKVQLLDDRRLISQLHGLERRTARGGKD